MIIYIYIYDKLIGKIKRGRKINKNEKRMRKKYENIQIVHHNSSNSKILK